MDVSVRSRLSRRNPCGGIWVDRWVDKLNALGLGFVLSGVIGYTIYSVIKNYKHNREIVAMLPI